jgi:hypothetical protein
MRLTFWGVALLLGAFQAWAGRQLMNPDGVSYLDMGDAIWRGDWDMVVNGCWSPLYPLLLGTANHVLHPSSYAAFAVAHLVNLLILAGTIVCFEFFLRQAVETSRARRVALSRQGRAILSERGLWAIGYAVFLWTSLYYVGVWVVTPDLMVTAVLYVAAGLLLRIQRGGSAWTTFLLLGTCLGVGYLVKASLFPTAVLCLILSVAAAPARWRALPKAAAALLAFAVVVAPLVTALSVAHGRFTFGESGTITYMRLGGGMPDAEHWQGEPPGTGTPKHPTRILCEDPRVYEFAGPVKGSYPLGYEPSYWVQGMRLRMNPEAQLRTLRDNLDRVGKLLYRGAHAGLVVGLLVLLALNGRAWTRGLKEVASAWVLLIPALAAVAVALPLHVESRYLGGYLALFWVGAYTAVAVPDVPRRAVVRKHVELFVVICLLLQLGWVGVKSETYLAAEFASGGGRQTHLQWRISEDLRRAGLQPGDQVGIVGEGKDAVWARLLGVRVIAESSADAFWSAPSERRRAALEAFRHAGVRAVVAERPPETPLETGWIRLPESKLILCPLNLVPPPGGG